MPIHVFFSHSHKDEHVRNELDTHLSTLKRESLIATWHDRQITAGSDFSKSIQDKLDAADIILLLVSPYFIESNYCYEIEMARALERHREGSARVIPIIAEHCEWHSTPIGELLAISTDGSPISEFDNRHKACNQVAKAIRAVVQELVEKKSKAESSIAPSIQNQAVAPPAVAPPSGRTTIARSSNLGLRKNFTDRDKDLFLESSFESIAEFFNQSECEEKQDAKRAPRFNATSPSLGVEMRIWKSDVCMHSFKRVSNT